MDSFKLSVVLLQQHDYDYWLTGHSVLIVFTDGKSASMSVVSWSPWPTVASSVYRPGIYSPARLERTVPGRLASHFGTKKPCTTYRCVNSQHNRTYCASIQSYIHSKKRVWFIIFIFPWNCMNISSRRQQACLWSLLPSVCSSLHRHSYFQHCSFALSWVAGDPGMEVGSQFPWETKSQVSQSPLYEFHSDFSKHVEIPNDSKR